MKESNFNREISNFSKLKDHLVHETFLQKVYTELVEPGRALLTFRKDTATIYYNGQQLCSMSSAKNFMPEIYSKYLPLLRSKIINKIQKAKSLAEEAWRLETGYCNGTWTDVLPEILDHIRMDSSPESMQVAGFYPYSPLHIRHSHEIVLLDIEAAFSYSGEATDRIDAVFYHTVDRRLMFVEVKRLHDPRAQENGSTPAEVVGQLERYRDTIKNEKSQIVSQYNRVIDYYNQLSEKPMPDALDVEPLLGLLLVEFSSNEKEQQDKKKMIAAMKDQGFPVYAIGNTESATDKTLAAMYKVFQK